MNWTFIKLQFVQYKKDCGWYLKITSIEQLLIYLMDYERCKHAEAFINYTKSKEFHKEFKHKDDKWIGAYPHLTGKLESFNSIQAVITGEVSSSLTFNFSQNTKFKLLQEYGHILINHNTGCTWLTDRYKIVETIEMPDIIFPIDNKIKIIKWPAGKHYYAKVGALDVVIAGKQKWNTHTEAKRAGEEFLRRLKRKQSQSILTVQGQEN